MVHFLLSAISALAASSIGPAPLSNKPLATRIPRASASFIASWDTIGATTLEKSGISPSGPE